VPNRDNSANVVSVLLTTIPSVAPCWPITLSWPHAFWSGWVMGLRCMPNVQVASTVVSARQWPVESSPYRPVTVHSHCRYHSLRREPPFSNHMASTYINRISQSQVITPIPPIRKMHKYNSKKQLNTHTHYTNS